VNLGETHGFVPGIAGVTTELAGRTGLSAIAIGDVVGASAGAVGEQAASRTVRIILSIGRDRVVGAHGVRRKVEVNGRIPATPKVDIRPSIGHKANDGIRQCIDGLSIWAAVDNDHG
jgi:hypothetical protein